MKSKEMPKTRKANRKHRRRTLRRKHVKKGGYEGQQLAIPSAGFKIATPDSTDNVVHGI